MTRDTLHSVPARWEIQTTIPRHAFNARDVARAGDVWRAFQEVAVEASTNAGYPPARYRDERIAFVMRSMVVVHQAEARYGQDFRGLTWVRRFRRDMLSTREVRLCVGDQILAAGTQEWVHVDDSLKPVRGSDALLAAFPIHDDDETVSLPEIAEPLEGPEDLFRFQAWFTAMDPLNHANHPAYVDYCDEALARRIHAAGENPVGLTAHAEKVTFLSGLEAPAEALVRTRLVGRTGDAAVFEHTVESGDVICAKATTHRSLQGRADPLIAALST